MTETTTSTDVPAWFRGRVPSEWFDALDVRVDREEIVVVGTLAGEDSTGAEAEGAVARFRAQTREGRIEIAREAERRFGRKVAWGARSAGGPEQLFTHLAVPVMTRLRQPERLVLDTLVDAGVARSRSEALAWCVRLVGQHADDWLQRLRESMRAVEQVRAEGPGV